MTRRDLLRRYASAGVCAVAAPFVNTGRCALKGAPRRQYSVRTVDLVGRSLVIDMLGLLTLDWQKLGLWHQNPASLSAADISPIIGSGINVFHPAVRLNGQMPFDDTVAWLRRWNHLIDTRPGEFSHIRCCDDLAGIKQLNKVGIMLGMQDSNHFRTAADVATFHGLGQRVSQLTYNSTNRLGSGCIERVDTGLSPFGASIVAEMNRVGMAIDISHAGEQTSLEAASLSKRPVLVSHSNCRALVRHPRCKSDAVIRAMAKTGGVMGITGLRPFVSRRAGSIHDVLNHFDHIRSLVGVEHVGIGSDTDVAGRAGIDVTGLNHSLRIFNLTEGLVQRRYSNASIELILGGNFKRTITNILNS